MSKPKNVTFSLPPELIDKYKGYVRYDFIPSVNAGVKEALEQYSKKMEKEMLKIELLKAAQDPLFIEDLSDSMKDFEKMEAEPSKENSEW